MVGADDLAALSGAALAVASLVGLAIRPVRRIDARLHALEDGQAEIRAEMSPNHGGSMRDAINATRSDVSALRERFDDHLTYHRER